MQWASPNPARRGFPPIDEFVLPGVEHAARVGDYQAEFSFLPVAGLVRSKPDLWRLTASTFRLTAWFRNDYARESLGGLDEPAGATSQTASLVSQEFLDQQHSALATASICWCCRTIGVRIRDQFTIVGVYDYFPTAEAAPVTVVGNMEYIISYFGVTMPHRIWMRLEPGADPEACDKGGQDYRH